MDCPKCTGSLEEISVRDQITLHRCDACFGLWCKPDELAQLKSAWMSEALVDVGSPLIGEKLDRVKDVSCPLGHGPMEKHSDPEQRHIWYEQCNTCEGIFLDAGEFTDLKFKTLLDWVRGLFR
ncbi:MAG: zf-TFIIB domain-containing protein [Pseudomonadales bacterium]